MAGSSSWTPTAAADACARTACGRTRCRSMFRRRYSEGAPLACRSHRSAATDGRLRQRWTLSVDLPENDVERADDRNHVGEHVAAAHGVDGFEEIEARSANLAAIGLVGAVGDEVDAELAFRRLDGGVGLAARHMIALGIELELLD